MQENYNLAKWLDGKMDESELEAFKNTPEYKTYNKIKDFSSQLQAPDFDTNARLQEVITIKKEKSITQNNRHWVWKIAATVALFLSITLLYNTFTPTTQLANSGARKTFSLPDNSIVTLNAGSELSYKKFNWENNRNCNLTGEAFFKVAKGAKFDVNAALGKVTVLGTQFNVKARANRFEVACFEGRVKVTFNGSEQIITKGESLLFENGKALNTEKLTTNKPEWIENKAKFNSESLAAVFAEIQRQYGITIEFKGNLPVQKFTGTLPSNNLNTAIQIVSKTYQLTTLKRNKKLIVLTNEDKNQ